MIHGPYNIKLPAFASTVDNFTVPNDLPRFLQSFFFYLSENYVLIGCRFS